jgi:3-hydroxyisobutyrate dehydrogenase-like beta-hydroxyacid dehydrogenase
MTSKSKVLGILHPGEMGAAVGRVLVASGHEVLWCAEGRSMRSMLRAREAGLIDVGSIGAMLERADAVLSICPPQAALDVAKSVAGFPGLFLDANAISPSTAARVEAAITDGGGTYVDGGIIGGPPVGATKTRLYLSGARADQVASLFSGDAMVITVMGQRAGAASALKLAYSAWSKGTSALLLAIRAFARAEGVEASLLSEWSSSRPELLDDSIRAAHSAATKGWRWIAEMEEIASSFETARLPRGFHSAAGEIYRRSGHEENAIADTETLQQVLNLIGTPVTRSEGFEL